MKLRFAADRVATWFGGSQGKLREALKSGDIAKEGFRMMPCAIKENELLGAILGSKFVQ